MPGRRDIFLNGSIYHIFNRTIDKKRIFASQHNAAVFLDTLEYYRSSRALISYMHFRRLPGNMRLQISKEILVPSLYRVDILAYCLMPTHFHLILRQQMDGGIKVTMSDVLNSFTRSRNMLTDRKGPLFLPRFQSRHITSDEYLLHLSRYVHLNPYTGGVVPSLELLVKYPWSSYLHFIHGVSSSLVKSSFILEHFKNAREYESFVLNQADYQKSLESFKYIDSWQK